MENNKKQYLLYLQGLPASGKSTYALNKVKNEFNTIIVNRDSIRTMLRGEYKNFEFGSKMESLVTDIENATIYEALRKGYNVISDNTNFRLTAGYLKEMELAFPHIHISTKFFDIDLKTAIQRDQQREKSVGKMVIERFYKKYINKDYE
jgi:predicted kinase